MAEGEHAAGPAASFERPFEQAFEAGWTDGLPVVPPTQARLDEFMAQTSRAPDEIITAMEPIGRACTVEKAALNSILAGCLPQYLPVVLAALQALNDPSAMFHTHVASTGGAAQLIVVNGPIRERIGMNGGANAFGPGNRANATIGRAVRLVIHNVLGMKPGLGDQSTQGQPGKYTLSFAENEEASPWEPLSVERGIAEGSSAVTVMGIRPMQMMANPTARTPEQVLRTFGDDMMRIGTWARGAGGGGHSALILCPEHTAIFAKAGWTKAQVKEFLYESTARLIDDFLDVGKESDIERGERVHRGRGPDDILLVVAGGEAGAFSSFAPNWGGPVTVAIEGE